MINEIEEIILVGSIWRVMFIWEFHVNRPLEHVSSILTSILFHGTYFHQCKSAVRAV